MATTTDDLILTSPDGIWVDTRAYTDLAELVNARGDTETFVLFAREEVVSTSLTLPQSWHLLFARGGRIRVAAGGNLSVSAASVEAPAGRQIFVVDEGGSLSLTTEGRKVRLSWFPSLADALAAVPSGTTLLVDRDESINAQADVSGVTLEWEAEGPTLTLTTGAQLSLGRVVAGEWPLFAGMEPGSVIPRAGTRLKAEWFQDLAQIATVIDPSVTCTVAFNSVVANNVDGLVVPASLILYFEAGAGIDQQTGTTLTIEGGVFSLSSWRFGDGLIQVNGDEMAVGSYIRITDDLNQYITQIEPGKIRIGPETQFDPGYDPNEAYTTAQAAKTDATQAIADAAAAQAAADGKIVSFYQDEPPTGQAIGDIWFDTDDNNRAYYWNGTAWVDASDYRIVQALDAASSAQATADGKVTLFYADSGLPPANPQDGDLWFKTDANRLAVYDAAVGAWVDHNAGSVTYHQPAPPTNAVDGDIWYDTDDGVFYVYDAATSAWLAQFISYASYVQGTAPTNPRVGDIWYDTTSAQFKKWDGSQWTVEYTHTLNHIGSTAPTNPKDGDVWYNTTDGVFYVYDAATPQWLPQFKGNRTFYGATPPASPEAGDIWYDTSVGQFKRWDGSAWVQTQAGNYTYRSTTAPTNPEVGDIWMNPNDGKVQWWDGAAWQPYGDDTETVIKNGLVTTGTLIVRDGADNEQAGITGTEDTNPLPTDVRIWAGAPYATKEDAPFRVHKDGSVIAKSIKLSGIHYTVDTTNGVLVVFGGLLDDAAYTVDAASINETHFVAAPVYAVYRWDSSYGRWRDAHISASPLLADYGTWSKILPGLLIDARYADPDLPEDATNPYQALAVIRTGGHNLPALRIETREDRFEENYLILLDSLSYPDYGCIPLRVKSSSGVSALFNEYVSMLGFGYVQKADVNHSDWPLDASGHAYAPAGYVVSFNSNGDVYPATDSTPLPYFCVANTVNFYNPDGTLATDEVLCLSRGFAYSYAYIPDVGGDHTFGVGTPLYMSTWPGRPGLDIGTTSRRVGRLYADTLIYAAEQGGFKTILCWFDPNP